MAFKKVGEGAFFSFFVLVSYGSVTYSYIYMTVLATTKLHPLLKKSLVNVMITMLTGKKEIKNWSTWDLNLMLPALEARPLTVHLVSGHQCDTF